MLDFVFVFVFSIVVASSEGDWFMTTDSTEASLAVRNSGYVLDAINYTGYIFLTYQEYTVPLFRMYNAREGRHFYTTNSSENDAVLDSNVGWAPEGVTGYCLVKAEEESLPFYRFRNDELQNHFYTTSNSEALAKEQNEGYVYEGTICFLLAQDTGTELPLLRLFGTCPSGGDANGAYFLHVMLL